LDPKEELAGDIGAAFAGGANVGTAINVAAKARAAISVFMIRLRYLDDLSSFCASARDRLAGACGREYGHTRAAAL
jgi:hypothetical protein